MAKTNYSFFMSLCLLVVLSILQARSFADPQLTAPYVEYYHKMNIYDSLPKFKNKFTNQSYLTESNTNSNIFHSVV
jgi:hypothetical protein